jgi:hypothetical protein
MRVAERERQKRIASFVRVSQISSDASQDFYLPKDVAKKLYDEGKLDIDLTNSMYCVCKGKTSLDYQKFGATRNP